MGFEYCFWVGKEKSILEEIIKKKLIGMVSIYPEITINHILFQHVLRFLKSLSIWFA